MKSFVIYVKDHKKSEQYASICLESCIDKFDAELFEGVTPETLSSYEEKYTFDYMSPSRVEDMKKESDILYKTKKSCFLNHVRLWEKCVELNQPIAVIEQDSHCVRSWDNTEFDEVLILNVESALFKQKIIKEFWKKTNKTPPTLENGLHDYSSGLIYHRNNKWHNGSLIPGTAAYAVTPKGAKKLLTSVQEGWEQSDHFVNTKNVKIQYMMPEYFTFKLPNLNMSFDYRKGK